MPRAALLIALCSLSALAEPRTGAPFEISSRVGAAIPITGNGLQASASTALKLGYGLPFESRLQVFAELLYAAPAVTVGEGALRSTVTLHDFAPSVGLTFFLIPPPSRLTPWISAGLRMHLLRAVQSLPGLSGGSAYEEADTRMGGFFTLGCGLRVGPGRFVLEVTMNELTVRQRITGEANATTVSVLGGYGFVF